MGQHEGSDRARRFRPLTKLEHLQRPPGTEPVRRWSDVDRRSLLVASPRARTITYASRDAEFLFGPRAHADVDRNRMDTTRAADANVTPRTKPDALRDAC